MDPTLSVPVLAQILDTPDIMELLAIHRVFRVHAFHALPLLVEKTAAPEPLVRTRAIQGLGMLRDTRTLDVLLNGLEEQDPGVRAAAARAVGDLLEKRRGRALGAIREALERSHEQSSAGPVMDYLLEAGSTEAVLSVAARAFPLDYKDYKRFLEASTARGGDAALRDCAASLFQHRSALRPILERWIRDIGRPHGAVRSIRPLLNDPEPLVRGNAAYALGQMDDTAGLESLVERLKDDDLRVRDAAALSLVLFGDRAVEPVRLAMARGDRRMRIIGLDLLGRINTPGARACVSEYLDDPARSVREAAERALGLQQP
jgi:HEAT repeat protein